MPNLHPVGTMLIYNNAKIKTNIEKITLTLYVYKANGTDTVKMVEELTSSQDHIDYN